MDGVVVNELVRSGKAGEAMTGFASVFLRGCVGGELGRVRGLTDVSWATTSDGSPLVRVICV